MALTLAESLQRSYATFAYANDTLVKLRWTEGFKPHLWLGIYIT